MVCVAFSAVYWAVFLCAHFVRQKLWLKAACLVVLGGLCFGAANPPLQAPDETGHYLRAYALGSGHFTFRQDEDFPADVDALCEAFPGFYNRELIEPGLATMAEGFTRYENLKASGAAAPASTLVQQFFGYIPQAAGVAAGRLFGADALWCMYLARLANLLCYAALCGMAVYLAGRFLPILLALMLNLILLVLGCIMDMAPIILIATPILLPIATSIGLDPIQFGIMVVLNCGIGLLTPPVGAVLFIGSAVAKVPMERVVKATLPFYLCMIITLLLITFIPAVSMWLPNVLGGMAK